MMLFLSLDARVRNEPTEREQARADMAFCLSAIETESMQHKGERFRVDVSALAKWPGLVSAIQEQLTGYEIAEMTLLGQAKVDPTKKQFKIQSRFCDACDKKGCNECISYHCPHCRRERCTKGRPCNYTSHLLVLKKKC